MEGENWILRLRSQGDASRRGVYYGMMGIFNPWGEYRPGLRPSEGYACTLLACTGQVPDMGVKILLATIVPTSGHSQRVALCGATKRWNSTNIRRCSTHS